MTAISQAVRTALLHFLWQGLAVAFILWVALFLLRKHSAQSRCLASCVALASMLALPAITAAVVYRASSAPSAGTIAAAPSFSSSTAPHAAMGSAAAVWIGRMDAWALPLWSAGVLLFSLRLVWGCWRVSAMRRRGAPAEENVLLIVAGLASRMGLKRPVRVLTAALPDGPSVVGWLRPVLLLPPATLLGLTPQQLEAVLAHELAHLRRYDHLVNAAQTLIETLLFYHPAVWWVSARIREERELCCDDLAVRCCGDALCFARALTRLERLRIMTPTAVLAGAGGSLKYRVQRLIGAGPQECAPSKASGMLALAMGLVSMGVSVQWVRAQQAPASETRTFQFTIPGPTGDSAGVSVDLGGAQVLHRGRVEYPEAARNSGIQGTVSVQVALDNAGNVADAHVVSGPMELRKTVLTSIFEWHFAKEIGGSTRVVNISFDKNAAPSPEKQTTVGFAVTVRPTGSEPARTVTTEHGVVTVTADDKQAEEAAAQREEGAARQLNAEREALLEVELAEARRSLAGADNGNQPEQAEVRRENEQRMQKLEERVNSMSAEQRGESERNGERSLERLATAGRSLANIEAPTLPPSVRRDLISRLPVQIGDTISERSLKQVSEAVHNFDEHLKIGFSVRPDGRVTLRIEAPGGVGTDK